MPPTSQRGRGQLEKLRRALFRRQWNKAESLIQQIPAGKLLPSIHVDQERWSVLHVAAMVNAPPNLVRAMLVVLQVEFCMQKDANGNNPLHKLCKSGSQYDVETVRLLAMAEPRAFHERNDEETKTPFDMMLLSMQQTDETESNGETSETRCSPSDLVTLIQDVACAWPEGMYSTNQQGASLLHRAIPYCCKLGDMTAANAILDAAPDLLERMDEDGAIPLHYAVRQKEQHTPALVEFLATYGEQCTLDLQNALERTPLHEACALGAAKRDVIEILVSRYPDALNLEDSAGMTPLALFRRHYKRRRSRSLKTETLIADSIMTLIAGAPVRCSDSPPPLLHSLLRNAQCTLDTARFLVTALSDQVSLRDENDDLPLHYVCSWTTSTPTDNVYFVDVVERLLDAYPAACKIPNHQSILPLELMARSGHVWSKGMRLVFLEHPAAVSDLGLNRHALCTLLEKTGAETTPDVMSSLLRDAPQLL